eukprot:COSAG06_NODE_22300_length_727_cov_16341.714968_1_plen_40_part_10
MLAFAKTRSGQNVMGGEFLQDCVFFACCFNGKIQKGTCPV